MGEEVEVQVMPEVVIGGSVGGRHEMEVITLSEASGSVCQLELCESPGGLLSGVCAHFGKIFSYEELRIEVARIFKKEVGELPSDMGFKVLFRCPYTNEGDAIIEEYVVVEMLVRHALALRGWQPSDVDVLLVGSSCPVVPNYAQVIASKTGLINASTCNTYAMACNSGGYALLEAFKFPKKRVLVLAMDNLTRLSSIIDPSKIDAFSALCFSSGAAALAFKPYEDMSLVATLDPNTPVPEGGVLVNRTVLLEDTGGALAAVSTYEALCDYDLPFGLEHHPGHGLTYLRLPRPDDVGPTLISMKSSQVGRLFLRTVPPIIAHLVKGFGIEMIHHVAAHHPSSGVKALIQRRLKNQEEVALQLPWDIIEGNTSGASTLTSLVRTLPRVNFGEYILVVSFGAGISITPYIFFVGG